MISPILAKLYGSILENKTSICLKSHSKRFKGQARFKGSHSIVDHIFMLRIIVDECHNNKTNLLCCFVDFRIFFDIVTRTNLWNMLEEIKFPFMLRATTINSYKKITTKFMNIEGWSKKIKCNIGVN
jgi:hypothetical protein